MKYLAAWIFIIMIVSCKNEKSISVINTLDFVLIDSSKNAKDFLGSEFPESEYPIYYIGPKQDTIRIGRRYTNVSYPRSRLSVKSSYNSRIYSDKTIKLFVDEKAHASSPDEYLNSNDTSERDQLKSYNSFVITLENKTDSGIFLGLSTSLFYAHREIKSGNGKWIKLERKLAEYDLCGTSAPTIVLNPNEILISKLKRYSGPNVCEFRLAFGYKNNIVYSNVFKDSFNLKNFYYYKSVQE